MTDHLKTLREVLDTVHITPKGMSKALSALDALEQAMREPVAFVHWPISGGPRLMWCSNKVAEAAILKSYEKDLPNVLLFAAPPAQLAQAEAVPCGNRDHCGRFPFCGCGDSDSLPERDTNKTAEQQGLFRKFVVRRTDGSDNPGGKHDGCEYFVLDVDHDKHAKTALAAYAASVEETHPQLAADMRDRYQLAAPKQAGAVMPDVTKIIDAAVGKFLGWKLPFDFAPDAGISYDRSYRDKWGLPNGTNLFTAQQAKYMFECCLRDALSGIAEAPQPKEQSNG